MKKITGIGLGTFPFSNVFTKVDKNEAKEIVNTFLKSGGIYIETAPLYQINDLIREILSDVPREDYYLSTKCVTGVNKNGEKIRSGKYNSIIEQCDLQLRTLNVDYIDLYMMHFPPSDAPAEETMSALVHLQQEGKIREIGTSNLNLEQLREFNSFGKIRYIQNRFSLINRSLNHEMIEYCIKHGIENIPYQVIERGLLTNKSVTGFKFREGDLREKKTEFSESVRPIISRWVCNYLKPIADDFGVSVEVLTIWWTLQQPITSLCVIGVTNRNQMEEIMKATRISPPAGTMERIESAYQILASCAVRRVIGLE